MSKSGLSATQLFVEGAELDYDDFTILDTNFSTISKRDVSLETRLGKDIRLKLPFMASPMDSVVSPKLAIAMAQMGGIAVIHYNHKDAEENPSVEKQIEEIRQVKRFQNGFIENPVAVSPDMTIAQVIERGYTHRISDDEPIKTFPVTHDGTSNGKLVGLLESDAYFRGSRQDTKVEERMIRRKDLITREVGVTLEQATEVLWENRIKSLPIIDGEGRLAYLVTKADIDEREKFSDATLDEKGRLRVLFAVSTWPESQDRVKRGFEAGADGVVVDTSQGHGKYPYEMLKYVADRWPDKLLIGGNISTAEAAVSLAKLEYVHAYRCGQGSGSICTTEKTIGIGRAPATAIFECARALRELGSPMVTIADGGLKSAGDIYKALALESGAVMLGGMLAGSEECPGEIETDGDGRRVMTYWGMGSRKAQVGGKSRRGYGSHEEGIVKRVPFKGSVRVHLPEVVDALRHSFEVGNYKNIRELQEAVRSEEYRFGRKGAN